MGVERPVIGAADAVADRVGENSIGDVRRNIELLNRDRSPHPAEVMEFEIDTRGRVELALSWAPLLEMAINNTRQKVGYHWCEG